VRPTGRPGAGRGQVGGVRPDRGHGGLLQGPQRQGRPEGGRRRGERRGRPVGGAAVRDQRGRHPDLCRARPAAGRVSPVLSESASSRAVASLGGLARRPYLTLAGLGHQATFVVRAFRSVPMTLRLYPGEVLRLLGDICWGSGAIVVGGGTIGVMVLLALFTGAS